MIYVHVCRDGGRGGGGGGGGGDEGLFKIHMYYSKNSPLLVRLGRSFGNSESGCCETTGCGGGCGGHCSDVDCKIDLVELHVHYISYKF